MARSDFPGVTQCLAWTCFSKASFKPLSPKNQLQTLDLRGGSGWMEGDGAGSSWLRATGCGVLNLCEHGVLHLSDLWLR